MKIPRLSRFSGLLVIMLVAVGCASPATGTFSHTAANASKVKNTIVIDKPFENAWNDMIKRMTVTQYRINNIEKASRIINLEYQIDNPSEVEKYIDCGVNHRVIDYDGKKRKFDYSVANSNAYEYVVHDEYYYWYEVAPKTILSGTVNVYMSPLSDQQTEISVNVRYRAKRSFSGDYYTQRKSGEYLKGGDFTWDPVSFTLNTNQFGEYPTKGAVPINCYSKGTIEREFLSYAQE